MQIMKRRIVSVSVLALAMVMALLGPATTGAAAQTDSNTSVPAVAATQDAIAPSIGQVKRLYRTILGRDAEQAGLEYWMGIVEGGASLPILARSFLASEEWNNSVGDGLTDTEYLNRLYQQAFGRAPDAAGLAYWRDEVLGRGIPQYEIVNFFAESQEQKNATAPVESLALNVLHINDHHSHLANDSITLNLGGADTDVDAAGFPRVVAQFKALEASLAGENVVKVHAGDAITGTLYYSLFGGEPDAALMNEVCFDVFALGNHEFDDGDQGLADFLGQLNSDTENCETPALAANVVPGENSPIKDLIQPNLVIDYGDQQVGYVGIDIANKTKNSSSPDPDTQFLDEVETAQAQIDELTAAGVDKIVLVTHYQYDNDIALAKMVKGVDVIIGGDSHTLLGEEFTQYGLNPSGPYPTMATDKIGAPVCIAQAWEFSRIVGHIAVSWDEYGFVNTCGGTPHMMLGDNFTREVEVDGEDTDVALTGADLDAVVAEVAAAPELNSIAPDADAQALLDTFTAQIEAETGRVIGQVSEDLCLERIPGQGRSAIDGCTEQTAQQGGDVQQLVAEAFRARSLESDIGIQNAGGVRVDVEAGDFTIADAYEILPFSNTLVNLEMTGAQVKAVLEDGLDFALQPDGSTGAYPYAAGLRFDVDATAAKGSRLTNLEYRAKGTTDWVAFDLGATYTVVTNDFIAGGRDGYLTFNDIDPASIVNTQINYAQGLIDYVEKDLGGTITKVPAADYSTKSYVPLPPAAN